MTRKHLLGAVMLMGLTTVAGAAELTVPSPHATIQAAVTAAAPGDTIVITNSGVHFADDVVIDKPLTIKAAAGETPTITNAQPLRYPGRTNGGGGIFLFENFADPGELQIGSLDGGRINFIANSDVPGYGGADPISGFTPIYWFFPGQVSSQSENITTVTLENLHFIQTGNNKVPLQLWRDDTGGTFFRHLAVRNVEYNANFPPADDVGIFRIFRQNMEIVIEHSKFYNETKDIIYLQRTPVVHVSFSEFGAGNPEEGSVTDLQTVHASGPPTLTIDNSLLRGGDVPPVFIRDDGAALLTITNSVLLGERGTVLQSPGVTNGIITLDHNDLVSLGGAADRSVIDLPASDEAVSTLSLTVTNTNLIGLGASTGVAVSVTGESGTALTVALDHNNAFAPGFTGGLYNATAQAGVTNSVSLDPEYTDIEAGDATYANVTLETAGVAGTYIGSDLDLSNMFPAPPVVNRARDWRLYD